MAVLETPYFRLRKKSDFGNCWQWRTVALGSKVNDKLVARIAVLCVHFLTCYSFSNWIRDEINRRTLCLRENDNTPPSQKIE